MIDTNEVWGWVNMTLPQFSGLVGLVVGVGIAAWVVGIIFDFMRKK